MPATTTIIRVDNTIDEKVLLFEGVYLVIYTPHISRAPSYLIVVNYTRPLCDGF
jgi:hypothetical protein